MWIYIHLPISDFQDRAFPELASSISQPELFTLQFNPSFSLVGIKALFVRVRIIEGAVIANHIFSSHGGLDKGCVISECFPPYFVYTLVSEMGAVIPPKPIYPVQYWKSCLFYYKKVIVTLWVLGTACRPPTTPAPCPWNRFVLD